MRKTEVMTKLKSNKAITLIALVITIIVLLILAGVAISMLSGENGILKQAANAKTSTDLANLSESIKLTATEILTSKEHKLSEAEFKTKIEQEGYKINEDGTVTQNSIDYALTNKGAVKATIEELKEQQAEMYAKITLVDTNDEQIVIPSGFKIKLDSPITVKQGIVVVAPDGSEFVWVPVKNAIYDSTNENASKIPISAENGSSTGYDYTPMAIEIDGEYKSLLYNFNSTGGAYLRYASNENYLGTTAGYTEPEALSDSSEGDYVIDDEKKGIALLKKIIKLKGTDDEIKEQWESQLQNDFNEMINSVHQNKGFYIGRYEVSLNELNNAQSKAGNKPASGAGSSTKTWYGLYQKTKEYSSTNNLTDFVGSSMTWGNQYDQMLIWFMNNNIDVTLESPINEEGITIVRNPTLNKVTGPSEDNSWYDKINNIYDLLGGMREWSIQAYKYKYRVTVGGYYTNVDETIYRLTSRISFLPDYGSDKVSTRISLYVK